MNNLRFGSRSLSELQGVRAELIVAATDTLSYISAQGPFDMSVFDGLRSEAEQRKNIRRGVSWTMNSLHLPQADGFAHAVDLVPYLHGRLLWEGRTETEQLLVDECFDAIANGMLESAKRHGFELRWGYDLWGKDKPHFQLGL